MAYKHLEHISNLFAWKSKPSKLGIILFIIVSSACVMSKFLSTATGSRYRPPVGHCIDHCAASSALDWSKYNNKRQKKALVGIVRYYLRRPTQARIELLIRRSCAHTQMTIWYCCEKKRRYETRTLEHRKSGEYLLSISLTLAPLWAFRAISPMALCRCRVAHGNYHSW